ncbi:PDZ domain-containing protein [soil metagenome]
MTAAAVPDTLIHYSIIARRPEAHVFEVTLTIAAELASQPLDLALPAWIPGSYMIREFARNIVSIEASCRGKPVALVKTDKHSWSAPAVDGALVVRCEVYAWDLSVRAAHLDRSHGFFNGTSVFLRVRGHEHRPCSVDIRRPPGRYARWQVATALTRAAGTEPNGFGVYLAGDYDELVDHPVEMGTFLHATFRAAGVDHEVAITGVVPNLDLDRLLRDLKTICESQIRLFEPRRAKAPFDRYVFFIMTLDEGYGGLEHRASTALVCKRDGLPILAAKARSAKATADRNGEAYRTFLGLASHEYFHSWNVKRIKPAVFAPTYALDAEVHTRLLWVFEGFTSYYDDLTLVRTGLFTREQYLAALAKVITGVHANPGRLHQSVADSSFDAWTKYYRQDENSPNAIVSYYQKGSLVALCLDLLIRTETNGKRSLDDVMRLMWDRFGRTFYDGDRQGIDEEAFASLAEEATGVSLKTAVRNFAYGTSDLPLERLLAKVGIATTSHDNARLEVGLGVRVKSVGNDCVIANAIEGQAGMAAGLSAGDVIAAIDGLRVTAATFETLMRRYRIGDVVTVHAFRRDELFTTTIALQRASGDTRLAAVSPKLPATTRRLLDGWLGVPA